MESRGLTLESLFRAKYKLPQETDVFSLIQAAIMVASWEKPKEFLMRRMSIAEAIFSKDSCSVETADVEDTGSDDEYGDGDASNKRSLITSTINAISPSKDHHGCSTMKKDCACSDGDGSKKGMRIIKFPKQQNGVTSDVNKKLDQDMGLDGQVDGKNSIKDDHACVMMKKHRAHHSDTNCNKKRRRIIEFSETRKEVTGEINRKVDQDLCCNGQAHGKSLRKRPLTTKISCAIENHSARSDIKYGNKKGRPSIDPPKSRKEGDVKKKVLGDHADAGGNSSRKKPPSAIADELTVKKHASTMENHCSCSNDNVKRRRQLTKSSENRKEVTTEIKKKVDQDMAAQTNFEAIIRNMESMHQQIRENKWKMQVLDVEDLPPPKSRCNNIPYRRPCNRFNKEEHFRRPLWG